MHTIERADHDPADHFPIVVSTGCAGLCPGRDHQVELLVSIEWPSGPGLQPLTAIELQVRVPRGLSLLPPPWLEQGDLGWRIPDLEPGQGHTYEFEILVPGEIVTPADDDLRLARVIVQAAGRDPDSVIEWGRAVDLPVLKHASQRESILNGAGSDEPGPARRV